MPTQCPKDVVDAFLNDMRAAIKAGRYAFIPRRKNLQTLAAHGLLLADVLDELMHLTFANYISGPETDRDRPSSDPFWIFKSSIEGERIYIKVKIEYQTDKGVKIVSFHMDEC